MKWTPPKVVVMSSHDPAGVGCDVLRYGTNSKAAANQIFWSGGVGDSSTNAADVTGTADALPCADRKAVRAIFSELDEINAKDLIFPGRLQNTEGESEESQGPPHMWAARATPWPRRPERLQGAAAIAKLHSGDRISVPARRRDGEVPPEAISINATASIMLRIGQVARPCNRQDVCRNLRDDVEGPGPTQLLTASRLIVLLNHCSPVGFGRQHILARPVGHSSTTTTSTPASEMADEQIKYEDLPPEHKKKYNELKAIFEADLIGSFEKTRSHGIRFKWFQPEGAFEGIDLSLPSEDRTRALRQEINYAVAHSLHRHSESLVNTLERVALRVVQEIMKHQYSPSGPALGTHQGEIPFYTRPPLPYTLAAPQQQGSPAYVVYKVGGDPGDYQFLYEPPKEIPHGYVCTYVSDCNNWMNQITAGGIAGAGGSSGADVEKQAWLAKYATGTSHESSTASAPTVDQISAILRDQFGILPKKRTIGYSKPYPNEYDLIPLPPKYRLPDFTKFSGSEGSSSIEHVRQRRGETVSEYIQRFRTVKNRCYSVRLSEKEAVELAIAGLSAPLKDLTFQADYNSLAHMVQKLTSYEQRHPELYQDKFKRVALVETEEDEDSAEDQEVAVAEWARGQYPCPANG
ncbi:hypothetical protein QYE76_003567 [Lolium multiflorum]|uniref:Retrotransposon gag domain-containing protein n=1 Tax=Lolium multiflorum TaxID=4521 RepID=A0AAD8VZC8_LOLMU|nr:hypothetical protein QYE76_003567 [Lolium multiflorum]